VRNLLLQDSENLFQTIVCALHQPDQLDAIFMPVDDTYQPTIGDNLNEPTLLSFGAVEIM
jgi:hypothetical protein